MTKCQKVNYNIASKNMYKLSLSHKEEIKSIIEFKLLIFAEKLPLKGTLSSLKIYFCNPLDSLA